MIQMLTYSGKESAFDGPDIVINKIHDAQSLDEFDINIINLNDCALWRNSNDGKNTIDEIKDLISLSSMIQNSIKTEIIIIFPQNLEYYYFYSRGSYSYKCELKDMLRYITQQILCNLYFPLQHLKLYYENTRTKIGSQELEASFYFYENENILLKSEKSNKATTIIWEKIILTTLNIKNYSETIQFLQAINLLNSKKEVPDWIQEIKMFDDNEQLDLIESNRQAIQTANQNIEAAQEKINKNNEFKSILYTNGDELVKVVFEILEEMFDCDLSDFEDKKKEDFLFDIGDFTFIGEIKGVNHNVKSENISQLDVHYQGYLEEHEKDEDKIKALLIIDHQKNKPLQEREPVHERQISLAERNGSLIIETSVLLKLFEKYRLGALSREKWIETVKSKKGILSENITE